MDYEARDRRAIIIIVLTILCFIEAYTYFTSYKSEKLICNREKNTCVVERKTRLNKVDSYLITDMDKINDVTTRFDSVRNIRRDWLGRRRSSYGHRVIIITASKKYPQTVFLKLYKQKELAEEKAAEIKMKLEDETSNIIEVSP